MRNIRINKAQKKKFYYLREDIVTDLGIVNKLFSIIEHLKSQKDLKAPEGEYWSKEQILSLYKGGYEIGLYDKIIKQLSEIYSGLGREDLFTIDKNFLDRYYESLTSREEIAAAGMNLGNSFSKIPGQLIDRNTFYRDEKGLIVDDRTRNWSGSYVAKLGELYNKYLTEAGSWLFMERVTLRPEKEVPGRFAIDVDNGNEEEFEEFKKWFYESKFCLETHKNFYRALRDFYMYSKLKYCESYFYQMKAENMVELLNIQEKGDAGIHISDSTAFDKVPIREEERDRTILLCTEIPGHSNSYIYHFKLDKLNELLGKNIDEPINVVKTRRDHIKNIYFAYKLPEEQMEYLEDLDLEKLNLSDRARRSISYMQTSIRRKRILEKKRAIEEKSEKIGENETENLREDKTEEKTKKSREKKEKIDDATFTIALCEKVEKNLEIHIPEEYIGDRSSKNGLMYKSEKQSCNLSHIYEQIKDFMRVRLGEDSKEQDETHIEDEANKMYIYMKLVGKGFWNLLYKDKRSRILSESYEKYRENFDVIVTAIKEGVPIEKLKDYVKKHTAPKIKDSIAKSPRKLKGEKGTAEKLERNVREEGELFSDSETIESNDQIEDEERKKEETKVGSKNTIDDECIKGENTEKELSKEAIMKKSLIRAIETKKQLLELKRRELALLEEEIKDLEDLRATMEK